MFSRQVKEREDTHIRTPHTAKATSNANTRNLRHEPDHLGSGYLNRHKIEFSQIREQPNTITAFTTQEYNSNNRYHYPSNTTNNPPKSPRNHPQKLHSYNQISTMNSLNSLQKYYNPSTHSKPTKSIKTLQKHNFHDKIALKSINLPKKHILRLSDTNSVILKNLPMDFTYNKLYSCLCKYIKVKQLCLFRDEWEGNGAVLTSAFPQETVRLAALGKIEISGRTVFVELLCKDNPQVYQNLKSFEKNSGIESIRERPLIPSASLSSKQAALRSCSGINHEITNLNFRVRSPPNDLIEPTLVYRT